jgi:hypothetical protein
MPVVLRKLHTAAAGGGRALPSRSGAATDTPVAVGYSGEKNHVKERTANSQETGYEVSKLAKEVTEGKSQGHKDEEELKAFPDQSSHASNLVALRNQHALRQVQRGWL